MSKEKFKTQKLFSIWTIGLVLKLGQSIKYYTNKILIGKCGENMHQKLVPDLS